jgi:dihydrolipoamide dehydrogenase
MIIVIGGGPGGRIASMRLASAGKEVILIERGGIGGQCLHHGCMPVCALNDVARMIAESRTFHDLGITDSYPKVNFIRLLTEMQQIQDTIAGILASETKKAGVEIICGKTGRLDGREVYIGDERVAAEAVIAATGSQPNMPAINGIDLDGVYIPHTIKTMKKLPEKLAIIGGGVMAAEFAYIFSRFGCDVTVLSRSSFLKTLDRHLRALAIKELEGVDIREGMTVRSVNGEGVVGSVTAGDARIDADAVLVAAGLLPRSEMLDGVEKGPSGEVIVDKYMRTSVPGVYACGDVTGPPYLTPVARYQGIVAADNILGRERTMDLRFIPQSLSLAHELAFCIPDPDGAASATVPGPAGPGTFWSVPSGTTGLAKVLFDAEDGSIRGICSAGPGGGLIAGYMAFLMRHHFPLRDFEDFIEVHPSTDGVYGLLKYASEVVERHNRK